MIKKINDIIPIAIIVIIAIVVRVINLEGYPTWHVDEGYYIQLSWNIFHGYWGEAQWAPHFFPPLYPVLLGISETIFEKSYFMARILGVIFGTISVVIIYLIGLKLYNRFIGLLAAYILAIAGLLINRMVVMDNGVELFFLLTILSYIKSKETATNRWTYLTAIFAGLAFLSKYQGIVAIIFLVIQSIIDRRTVMIKKGIPIFIALGIIYPLIGAIQSWNAFTYDMLYQAVGRNMVAGANTLDEGLAIIMFGLSEDKGLYPPYIFTLLGFLSFFYIAARNDNNDKIISSSIISTLLTLAIIVRIWWVFLIIILPLFSIAIAIFIYDITNQKNNWLLSMVLFSLISMPMFIKTVDYGVSYQGIIIIVIFATIFLLSNCEYIWSILRDIFTYIGIKRHMTIIDNFDKPKFQTINIILLFIIMTIFVGSSLHDIRPILYENNNDRYAVTEFLNKNTNKSDMVAAETKLLPLINATAVYDRLVLLNTTHEDLYLYPKELLSRFSYDVSIWKIKYIVLGQHWFDFEGVQTKKTEEVTNMILKSWIPVYKRGEYIVFLNPDFAIKEYKQEKDNTFSEEWHLAYMRGVKNNNFSVIGNNASFKTTTTEINGYVFWTRNVSVPSTGYSYFALRYKVNNPKVRIVVKFLDSKGVEIGTSEANQAWLTDDNPSISYKTAVYDLTSLSSDFLDKNVAQVVIGMDSFGQFGRIYVLDVDLIGFVGRKEEQGNTSNDTLIDNYNISE